MSRVATQRLQELHRRAIAIADKAELLRLRGREKEAAKTTQEAFELEKKAALSLLYEYDVEPTRSVLFRSAASFALECQFYSEAKDLIFLGLGGKPPREIADELRELLEMVQRKSTLNSASESPTPKGKKTDYKVEVLHKPRIPRSVTSRRGHTPKQYLTERQKAILVFIAEYQQRHGIPPTHREIREEFGYSSFGTVYKHLKLLQNKGFLRRDWNQKRGLELIGTVPGSIGGDQSEVPFLGLIAAGQPIEALPGNDRLAIPSHLLGGAPTEHYVLRVTGDSMIQDGIYDGDFIIVMRKDFALPGELVVALVKGVEATLKYFYPEGDFVRLQPANPEMDAIRAPAAEVSVQGIVVGIMRKF